MQGWVAGWGLLPHVHPRSSSSPMGKYLDAAIAGQAAHFVGNKISTFSYLIAGQLHCAGRGGNVSFYRGSAAQALAWEHQQQAQAAAIAAAAAAVQ